MADMVGQPLRACNMAHIKGVHAHKGIWILNSPQTISNTAQPTIVQAKLHGRDQQTRRAGIMPDLLGDEH